MVVIVVVVNRESSTKWQQLFELSATPLDAVGLHSFPPQIDFDAANVATTRMWHIFWRQEDPKSLSEVFCVQEDDFE
jgi:hypothetical protein